MNNLIKATVSLFSKYVKPAKVKTLPVNGPDIDYVDDNWKLTREQHKAIAKIAEERHKSTNKVMEEMINHYKYCYNLRTY
jgi:TfoX/Sxy family transcriptional regulator of competence genes